MRKLLFLVTLVAAFAPCAFTQLAPLDVAKLPALAAKPEAFVHAGWKVEQVVKGDLNGDGRTDAAIKLAQIEEGREGGIGGDRALVIALADGASWKRVAVGEKILQCVDCGGAFYGVMPAPANVTIEKGVLVIENEHGSRSVSNSTFRFRYNATVNKFVLIGYDYVDNDRLTGAWANESTNYMTNVRITKTGKGKRSTVKRTVIKPIKIYLDAADSEEIEGQALHRLGLD